MDKRENNSEELAEIIDKIFLLNHSIVNQMVKSHNERSNSNVKISPEFERKIEETAFEKMSGYFKELRDAIRTAVAIEKELIIANKLESEYNEETMSEIVIEASENAKQALAEILRARVEKLFVSMNFVRAAVVHEDDEEPEIVQSIYNGSLEEVLREQEYCQLMSSVNKQFKIIDFEDFFSNHSFQGEFIISPLMTPILVDSIADRAKYAQAEKRCKKYVRDSRELEGTFDEYPELRDTTEEVEFLGIEERYKREFEEAAGYLNTQTSYTEFFLYIYEKGLLHVYTHFEEQEINSRISSHIQEYSEENKEKIRQIFDNNVEKYKPIRRERQIKDVSEFVKLKISSFGTKAKKYIRNIKGLKGIRDFINHNIVKKQEKSSKEEMEYEEERID